jgi:hypothetical protein
MSGKRKSKGRAKLRGRDSKINTARRFDDANAVRQMVV